MLERTKRRWRLTGRITAISIGLGVALSLTSEGVEPIALLNGAVLGGLIGAALTMLEVFWLSARGGAALVKNWPLGLVLALRTVLYALCITAAYAVVMAFHKSAAGFAELGGTLAQALPVALVFSLALMVRRMLGPQATAHFLTGRYHRPRAEERLVLFVDVQESTALAERMGDVLFFEFLARTVFDISESVIECGGEVHRYVGDEVIVTWKLSHGEADHRALACPFVIAERIEENRAEYLNRFGTAPNLRGGFHAGPLIVGEMGDVKREIVMLGDTMNTAARIEGACRSAGRNLLASADALARSVLPPDLTAESIGSVVLRGKSTGMELFALAPRAIASGAPREYARAMNGGTIRQRGIAGGALPTLLTAMALLASAPVSAGTAEGGRMQGYDFEFTSIDGDKLPLSQYRGRPVLVVNTASFCGYTPQYQDLEALWRSYRERGLVVIGVPSNDFGAQEPGSATEIKQFCEGNYAVDFPLTDKQPVIGDEAHPFFRWIADELGEAGTPRWNFHKYLIAPDGSIAGAWPSRVRPTDKEITAEVEALLTK